MRSITKLLTRLALLLGALAACTVPALAAAPSNNKFAGAQLVTLGFSETLDTTEATTSAIDAQLLQHYYHGFAALAAVFDEEPFSQIVKTLARSCSNLAISWQVRALRALG
jgi:hypothetical protein